MSIICKLFGHNWSAPVAEDTSYPGVYKRIEEICSRCDEMRLLDIRLPHTHNYGRKYQSNGIWLRDCACGHATEAPAPKKRKAREVAP